MFSAPHVWPAVKLVPHWLPMPKLAVMAQTLLLHEPLTQSLGVAHVAPLPPGESVASRAIADAPMKPSPPQRWTPALQTLPSVTSAVGCVAVALAEVALAWASEDVDWAEPMGSECAAM